MQLQISFSLLLGSILFALLPSADAAPYTRGARLVSVPLAAAHIRRNDLPASVYLQQHLNHAQKRHCKAVGVAPPSAGEQTTALQRRIDALPSHERVALARRFSRVGTNPNTPTLEARYNRPTTFGSANASAAKDALAGAKAAHANGGQGQRGNNASDHDGQGTGGRQNRNGNGNDGRGGNGGAGALKGDDGNSSSATASAAAPAATAAAGNGTAAANPNVNGFSPVAAAAQKASGLTQSKTPTTKGSLALDVEANDVGYISTIQIGTPPRDFRVIMDSGSADLWVGAEQCQTIDDQGNVVQRTCGQHTFLGATASSSFKDTKKAFQVTYGSGAVAGTIVTDNLNFAGLDIPAHTFGAAQLETVQFSGDEVIDGLMGLAKSELSNQGVLTPPEAMAKAGLIQEAITSYRIPRVADGLKDGQVTFGGVDPATIDKATLVTVDNISKNGFWEAAMTLSIDGKDTGLQGRTAILDTGTTLILAPDADAAALHQAIDGAKFNQQVGFTVPCTTSASIAMTFGSQTFAIDPRDLIFTPVDPADPKGDCVSGIQAGQVGGANQWLVGDVFLKNVIFAHDVGNNAISLAKPAAGAAADGAAGASTTASASATASATASASASATASSTDSASASVSASATDSAAAGATETASLSTSASVTETASATDSALGTANASSDGASAAATVSASDSASASTSAMVSGSLSEAAAAAKATGETAKA